MNEAIQVRIATRDDAKKIAEFNVNFAKETINKNLSLQTTKEGVHKVFSSFNNGFYLVAEVRKQIVGISMVTREWSDWSNGAYYCIQGIFVSNEEHATQIHDAIFQKAKSLAKEHDDVCGIRLYVDKDDKKTQKQYETLGMKKTPYRLFEEEF
ncbi:MAG: GNAT family N-acetyltransferase [Sulfurospirillum sp.]|nr:GNAT family N-acetyltransferase [Sulfurospirillum sp.]